MNQHQWPRLKLAVLPVAMALVACGAADNDPGPGGVTVGEARALDEAADMLDSRNIENPEVLEPPKPGNAEVSDSQ